MASHDAPRRRWWHRTPTTAPQSDPPTEPTPTVDVGDPAIRAFENRHHEWVAKQAAPVTPERYTGPYLVPAPGTSFAPIPFSPPPPMPKEA